MATKLQTNVTSTQRVFQSIQHSALYVHECYIKTCYSCYGKQKGNRITAQQPYSAMKRQYKRKLPQMFNGNLQWIRSNLTFGSFSKQHGGHQSISAADMVYAITAVLESDEQTRATKQSSQSTHFVR
eukprot:728829_1